MALYDPKEFPEAPTVSPDFTVAEFLAWVRTKPADEEYDVYDADACAIAQFGVSECRPRLVGVSDLKRISPWAIDAVCPYPHTFGALAKRLEALL